MIVWSILVLSLPNEVSASDHADLVKACLLRRPAVSADQDEAGDINIAASYNRYCEAEAAKVSGGEASIADKSSAGIVGQKPASLLVPKKPGSGGAAPTTDGPKATAASDKAAQAPVKKAAASAQNTQPQPAGQASPDASSDIQTCREAVSNVRSCCTNPASCLTNYSNASVQDGGLTDYCKQMTQAGANSKNINDAAAAVCSDRKSSCQGACDKLIQKYQTLSGSCSGCDSQGIYDDALASLQSVRGQCGQYDAVTDALVAQGIGGNRSGQAGDSCSAAGSSSPSG